MPIFQAITPKKEQSYAFTEPTWTPGERYYQGEYLDKVTRFQYQSFWNITRPIKYDVADEGNCDEMLLALTKKFPSVVIAGSAAAYSYIGEFERAHDVDLFFTTKASFDRIIQDPIYCHGDRSLFFEYKNNKWWIDKKDLEEYMRNPEKVRFLLAKHDINNRSWYKKDIQLNKMIWYQQPEAVIQSFDLTCCKVAIRDGSYFYDVKGLEDLENGEIRITGVWHVGNTLSRILKYRTRGFTFDGCNGGRLPSMSNIKQENPIQFKDRGNPYVAIETDNNGMTDGGLFTPEPLRKSVDKDAEARYHGFNSYDEMKKVMGW